MEYIQTGEIVSTHGIKGEIKIYPHADHPQMFLDFDTFYIKKNKMHYKELKVETIRVHKNMVLVKFLDIDSVELARNLIGSEVYLNKDEIELPEGRYFVSDLIGSSVVNDDTNEVYGSIYDIKFLGASDIYYIKNEEGKEFMFPAVDEFIKSTDIEKKEVRVVVIEGMFSEN